MCSHTHIHQSICQRMCSCFQNYMDRQYSSYSMGIQHILWLSNCCMGKVMVSSVDSETAGVWQCWITPLFDTTDIFFFFFLVSSCQALWSVFEAWTFSGCLTEFNSEVREIFVYSCLARLLNYCIKSYAYGPHCILKNHTVTFAVALPLGEIQ